MLSPVGSEGSAPAPSSKPVTIQHPTRREAIIARAVYKRLSARDALYNKEGKLNP